MEANLSNGAPLASKNAPIQTYIFMDFETTGFTPEGITNYDIN
jgi:hypothetical protein